MLLRSVTDRTVLYSSGPTRRLDSAFDDVSGIPPLVYCAATGTSFHNGALQLRCRIVEVMELCWLKRHTRKSGPVSHKPGDMYVTAEMLASRPVKLHAVLISLSICLLFRPVVFTLIVVLVLALVFG